MNTYHERGDIELTSVSPEFEAALDAVSIEWREIFEALAE